MKQDLKKIERLYDSLAREYTQKFIDAHQKKPKDQEILCQAHATRLHSRPSEAGPKICTYFKEFDKSE